MNAQVWLGILLPFLGTSLGAAMVFVLKDRISDGIQRMLTGFAAGVMVAASFWSLLQPALDGAEHMGKLSFIPAAVGFLVGIGFLLLLDNVTPHMHMDEQSEGPRSSLKRTTKLILAVTLHNIPEGMAVGVVYAGWVSGETGVSQAAALALAVGIALQNFPEGAIVSMPLRAAGKQDLPVRGPVRYRGTHCGFAHHCGIQRSSFDFALPAGLCRRCHDVRRGGGTDSGDVRRQTLQCGYSGFRTGICADDGAGCGTGIIRKAIG